MTIQELQSISEAIATRAERKITATRLRHVKVGYTRHSNPDLSDGGRLSFRTFIVETAEEFPDDAAREAFDAWRTCQNANRRDSRASWIGPLNASWTEFVA